MDCKRHSLVVGVACCVGLATPSGETLASVVVFDNSAGTFVLSAQGSLVVPPNYLDPTVAAIDQIPLGQPARAIRHGAAVGGGSESPNDDALSTGASIRLAQSTTPIIVTNAFGVQTTFFPATVFDVGQQVGASENYQRNVATALLYLGGGAFHTPFLGQHPYIGFRVENNGNPHYGWVELDFRTGPLADGGEIPMYQPIRWAYETEPNTPITVPGLPGAALLLVAAAATSRRRR